MAYKISNTFNTPVAILKPEMGKKNGVSYKIFTESEPIFVSFKSYGGTEKVIDDVYVIEDTAVLETWFNPDIKNDCNIKLLSDGSIWEILNVENIEMKNHFSRIKIRRVKGGA